MNLRNRVRMHVIMDEDLWKCRNFEVSVWAGWLIRDWNCYRRARRTYMSLLIILHFFPIKLSYSYIRIGVSIKHPNMFSRAYSLK
jgi:hypothetical protein